MMIRINWHWTVIASALLCGACTTTLETRPAYQESPRSHALPGISYSLPMLQYEIPLSYKITSCPSATGPLNVVIKASAVSGYVAGETYAIDYAALSSTFKVTDFAIQTYKGSGTLQSINASAEDKTADVIKSGVELAVKVASIAVAPNPFSIAMAESAPYQLEAQRIIDAHKTPRSYLACTIKTDQFVTQMKTAKGEIETLGNEATAATAEIARITARARLGMLRKGHGKVPSDKERLLELHDSEALRSTKLAAAQASLKEAEDYLVFTDTRNWPASAAEVSGTIAADARLAAWASDRLTIATTYVLDAGAARRAVTAALTDLGEVSRLVEKQIKDDQRAVLCQVGETLDSCAGRHLAISADLVPAVATGAPCLEVDEVPVIDSRCVTEKGGAIDSRKFIPRKGIFIRQPVRARLVLCRGAPGCEASSDGALYRTAWDTVPQLGQLRFVPLENGPFQNNSISVQLREDGTIEKFQIAEKSSIAAAMVASAANVATGISTIQENAEKERKEREKERQEAIQLARAEIKYQRDEVTYQRTEVATTRAEELSQIQHQIEVFTKQKTLIALQSPAVSQELLDETKLLDAQLAHLKARLALLKAEGESAEASATSG